MDAAIEVLFFPKTYQLVSEAVGENGRPGILLALPGYRVTPSAAFMANIKSLLGSGAIAS